MVNDEHRAVCCGCVASEAFEIAEAHNKQDPIKSYEDWLFYRDKN